MGLVDVRGRDQERSADPQVRTSRGQIGDQRATETMPDQDGTRPALGRRHEPFQPERADRPVPIRLHHPGRAGIGTLPVRLPMIGSGAAEARNNENLHLRACLPLTSVQPAQRITQNVSAHVNVVY